MIGYWHHPVVRMSMRLSVRLSVTRGSVSGFALITALVLTFLFTGRDAAITMNSVKNRNHAVMSF